MLQSAATTRAQCLHVVYFHNIYFFFVKNYHSLCVCVVLSRHCTNMNRSRASLYTQTSFRLGRDAHATHTLSTEQHHKHGFIVCCGSRALLCQARRGGRSGVQKWLIVAPVIIIQYRPAKCTVVRLTGWKPSTQLNYARLFSDDIIQSRSD